jgi:cytochrome c oxidase subunit I
MNIIKKTAILIALGILTNALLLVFIWEHHMFVTELNPFLGLVELLFFLLIAIPLVILGIKKLGKYVRLSEWFSPASAFFLGFFILLLGDLLNSLIYGSSTLDFQVHDTYFVITHVHLMGIFALIFLAFFTVYWGYPRMTGKAMNAPLSYLHFVLTLIAVYALSWPVHYTGLADMPRRYVDYSNWSRMDQTNNFAASVAILLICAQVIFVINLIYSAVKGEK